jgi:hypothetical protein
VLVSYNFDEHALFAPAVELAVEDLFPRTKVEFPVCNGNNRFTPHNLSLEMRITVVFTGVVSVAAYGLVRRELPEPIVEIFMQTWFVIVNKYACRNVHCIYQAQTLADAAFGKRCLNVLRDVDEFASRCRLEFEDMSE